MPDRSLRVSDFSGKRRRNKMSKKHKDCYHSSGGRGSDRGSTSVRTQKWRSSADQMTREVLWSRRSGENIRPGLPLFWKLPLAEKFPGSGESDLLRADRDWSRSDRLFYGTFCGAEEMDESHRAGRGCACFGRGARLYRIGGYR